MRTEVKRRTQNAQITAAFYSSCVEHFPHRIWRYRGIGQNRQATPPRPCEDPIRPGKAYHPRYHHAQAGHQRVLYCKRKVHAARCVEAGKVPLVTGEALLLRARVRDGPAQPRVAREPAKDVPSTLSRAPPGITATCVPLVAVSNRRVLGR